MKPDILQRSFNFGVSVIRLVHRMPKETVSHVLSRQLVRSGTSIAANVEEAQSGVNRADFSNKMGTAIKEARETHLWLRFIRESGLVTDNLTAPLLDEAEQVKKILWSISKKVNPYHAR